VPAIRRTKMVELGWRVHRWLYRVSGGRIGRRMNRMPVLLLITTGRQSGKRRPVALQYVPEGESFVVIGSHAGEPTHPAWFLNLQANPDVTVQVGKRTFPARAREAEGEERERLWRRIVETDHAYQEYQGRVSRRIPVVVLDPR
jgi:deazaflavin-dependent oxidoreductase (nitroreductase family)